MNTPANGAQPKIFRLPAPNPNAPLLKRVVTSPPFSDQTREIIWEIGEDHPLAPGWKIVRMFIDHSGVEIYSLPPEGGKGHYTRNMVPMTLVKLTEEVMSVEVFVEELTDAEEDDDDDDDDDDADPEAGVGEGPGPVAGDGLTQS